METLGDHLAGVSAVSPRRSRLFFYETLDEESSDPAGDLNSSFVRRRREPPVGAKSHNRLSSPVAAGPIKNVSPRNGSPSFGNNARDASQLRRQCVRTQGSLRVRVGWPRVNSRARVELLKPTPASVTSQIIPNLSPPGINCSAHSNPQCIEAHQLFALLLQRSSSCKLGEPMTSSPAVVSPPTTRRLDRSTAAVSLQQLRRVSAGVVGQRKMR